MDGKKKNYQFEEDLVAGEYFGEAVLSGVRTRLITALATTQCDLITFEDDNFLAAQVIIVCLYVYVYIRACMFLCVYVFILFDVRLLVFISVRV